MGGVAYMAHIGGFVAGLLMTFLFRDSSSPNPTA
jgi:membrane associated rhomboid family serine protease